MLQITNYNQLLKGLKFLAELNSDDVKACFEKGGVPVSQSFVSSTLAGDANRKFRLLRHEEYCQFMEGYLALHQSRDHGDVRQPPV